MRTGVCKQQLTTATVTPFLSFSSFASHTPQSVEAVSSQAPLLQNKMTKIVLKMPFSIKHKKNYYKILKRIYFPHRN